jgi:hypothetical protein
MMHVNRKMISLRDSSDEDSGEHKRLTIARVFGVNLCFNCKTLLYIYNSVFIKNKVVD